MRPYRSLLFVPGHKPDWVVKAVRAGADAVILDLEDSVPLTAKSDARSAVAESIDRLHRDHPDVGVLVRPNPWDTECFGADVAAVVRPGLDALLLPKVRGPLDVQNFAALLDHFEVAGGMARGTVELVPSLETALSYATCSELATASPRVASLMAAAARDSDVSRELGFTWSAEGLETLYYRSRAVLACRAAGLRHPIVGLWQDIGDLAGLERFATRNLHLGFRGQVLIHPAHVEVVNRVYTPPPQTVERYRRMIAAFERAAAAGNAAVDFEGEHIDIAHVQTAREIVAMAENLRRGTQ
ncbi:MAG: CoA ester lyase [Microbispora sp.]|nr:CoA ester lyase [Microbispora sp.]